MELKLWRGGYQHTKTQDTTGGGTSFLGLTPGWWLPNSGIGRHLKEAVPYHK